MEARRMATLGAVIAGILVILLLLKAKGGG
jgi:hypothetical protein